MKKDEEGPLSEDWYKRMYEADTCNITWKLGWTRNITKYLALPEGQDWIPLIGRFGVISYSPNMVVRQFGDEQEKPSFVGVDSWSLNYNQKPQTTEDLLELVKIWEKCESHKINKIGGAKSSYFEWREEWVSKRKIPKNVPPNVFSKMLKFKRLYAKVMQDNYTLNSALANVTHKDFFDEYCRVDYKGKLDKALKEIERLKGVI